MSSVVAAGARGVAGAALYATRQLVIAHLQNFARGAKVLLKISPRAQ
jgi:hypothetical protein